jgi:hypothetical protein
MRSYAPGWGLVVLALILVLVGHPAIAPALFWGGLVWVGIAAAIGRRRRI